MTVRDGYRLQAENVAEWLVINDAAPDNFFIAILILGTGIS